MEFRKLHITLISCEDLTSPYTNKPIKKNAMGIIRMPHNVLSTTLDKCNGSYPRWNETFIVEMPVNAHCFDVEIRRGMDTVIGNARVPFSDFVNNLVPVGYLNCLSYRLRGRHGAFVKGIVNISVRVVYDQCLSNDKITLGRPLVQNDKISGLGKADHEDGCSGSGSRYGYGCPDGGVVTGIPVSYGVTMTAQHDDEDDDIDAALHGHKETR